MKLTVKDLSRGALLSFDKIFYLAFMVAGLSALVWVTSSGSSTAAVSNFKSAVVSIDGGVRALANNSRFYRDVSYLEGLRKANKLPPSWVGGDAGSYAYLTEWGELRVDGQNTHYTIAVDNVPAAECMELATQALLPDVTSVSVGGTVTAGKQLDQSTASSQCSEEADGSTLIWTMR